MADRQQKDQMKWTNWCFKKALLEHYNIQCSKYRKLPLDKLSLMIINQGWDANNTEINELYLKHVCQLSTSRLNIILQYNLSGKQRRSPHTIERIMDELFARAADPEKKG